MTEVKIRVWVDGEEIELSPTIRGFLEKKRAKKSLEAGLKKKE